MNGLLGESKGSAFPLNCRWWSHNGWTHRYVPMQHKAAPLRPVKPSLIPRARYRSLNTNRHLAVTLMSYTHETASSSSSNFQLIINNALKAYEKRTKKDLLAHPLAAQFQACGSPSAILSVLQQQVQQLDKSQTSDDRWTNWLGPTVNVLYAFSAILGEGVCLVCLRT